MPQAKRVATVVSRTPADPLVAALRDALRARQEIAAWTLLSTRTRSHELYMAREEVDARRLVETESVRATLYTRQGSRMGSARLRLGPGERALVDARVDEALHLAGTGGMEPFTLPDRVSLPTLPLSDEVVRESPDETLDQLRERLRSMTAGERNVRLAAAEFFLHEDSEQFETSTGVLADRSGTRTAAEIVLLGEGPDRSEGEVQDLRYRRRVEDFELEPWLRTLAKWARDAATAESPPTWTGSVVLPGNVLHAFLQPVVEQASEAARYQKGPSLEIGRPVGSGETRGEGLALATDATLPFGAASYVCDDDGVPGQAVSLIEGGILRRRWAERRFAEYAGTAATGAFGNLVVGPGSRYERDIRDEGNILEVMQFSWLTPNRTTGDFSSEVRFGYLSRGMARVPVHGGLLSGNVFEALAAAAWSREQGRFGNSYVPLALRVDALVLSGK